MSQRLDYQDSLCYPIAVCPAHLSGSPGMIINSKIYIMRFVSLAASVFMVTTTLGTPPTHPEDPGNTSSWPDGGESTAIAESPASIPKSATGDVDLYGNVIFSRSGSGSHTTNAIYKISSSAPQSFSGVKQGVRANGGGTATDKNYVAIGYTTDNNGNYNKILYEVYDLKSWSRSVSSSGSSSIIACDIAYDPTTGHIYGCFNNDALNGYVFGTLNTSTWKRNVIRAIPSGFYNSVMCDANGQVYAITNRGVLLKINKTNGVETAIGSTGVVPYYTSSATIDPRTGRCFWTVSLEDNPSGTGRSFLYEVNLTTGAATQIYEFTANDEITGLFTPPLEANLKAPAAVQNLSVQFNNGSLSGNVSFLIPTTLYDGTTGSGEVNYKVLVNGTEKLSGTSSYGKALNLPLTIASAGQYTIEVRTSNSAGLSPGTQKQLWIGPDQPKIGGCGASWTPPAKMFSVNWAAAMGAHGGYIDRSTITYDVIRLPGKEKVSTGQTATRFNDTVSDASAFYARRYGIVAHAGGLSSDTVWTSTAVANTLLPPYSHNFSSTDDLLGYTIIDQGNDGRTWGYEALYDAQYKTIHAKHHQSRPKDDWVVTPPITLQAGYIYRFTADMGVKVESYPEDFEMYWGKTSSVSGLSNVLKTKTTINNVVPAPQGGYIKVEETGKYYVGIHACTRPNQFYIFATNFKFSEGMSVLAPAPATNLTVSGDYAGSNTDTIRFNAPALNLNDAALSNLDKVELLRDSVLIHTFNAPAPGAALSYIDKATEGYHTYQVIAYNEKGAGREAQIRAFSGVNIAAPPAHAVLKEKGNSGEVTLTWEPTTKDIDGKPLNPALVTYNIYEATDDEPRLIAEGLTKPNHTFRAVDNGKLAFVNYGIRAITRGGASAYCQTPSLCVGTPLQTTFTETFADATIHSIFGQSAVKANNPTNHPRFVLHNDTWRPTTLISSRSDNGFITAYAPSRNDAVRLTTAKVTLSQQNPIATLYLWRAASVPSNIPEGACDALELRITSANGLDTVMSEYYVQRLPYAGWNKIQIPLSAFSGQTVQLSMTVDFHFAAEVHLDDIFIGESLDRNLTLANVKAPKKAIAGKPVSFTAHAINNGNTAASQYTVVLKRNDEEVARKTSETLAADSLRSITIEDIMLPAGYNSDNVQYSLALLYDDEQYVADNTVDNIVIPVDFSTYPRPVELIASESHAGIRLKWNTPDMSQATPEPILETFEDFTSFDTKGSKGWKFLDMDHGFNSSLQGTTLPGITSQATGFFVLDRSFGPMANNNTFSAVSGKKYLSQFEAYPSGSNQPVVCNDWAILPELFGTSQTIRFYARSYNPNYLESFEFMTSSSNADPTSFTALKRYESIPATWTLYEIAVPAGTRYAAIRCFSQGKMMMHVDDVEFIPAGEANLHLSGYNVWMDNKCVNTELITANQFVVPVPDKLSHSYTVTAVYDKGESGPSNPVSALWTSVGTITDGATWRVSSVPGAIIISGNLTMPLDLYTADGRTALHVPAQTTLPHTIAIGAGVYIARSGSRSVKVIVP